MHRRRKVCNFAGMHKTELDVWQRQQNKGVKGWESKEWWCQVHYANYQSETSHITNIHESSTKSQLRFLQRWKQSYSRLERQTRRWNHQGDVRREQTKSDMHAVHSGSPHDDRTFAWWAINILVHMQEVETFMGINTPWTILILWDNLWPSFWDKFIRSILLNLAAAYQMLHHKLHVTLSVVRIPSSLQWHFWFQKWPWYQCRKRSNTWNYLNGHVHVRIL